MDLLDLYKRVEHTLLKPDASEIDVHEVLTQAHQWQCRAACIPPVYVLSALQYLEQTQMHLPIVSVAGFPLGYQSDKVKWTEIKELHALGVDEIDVVCPLYLAKAGAWDKVDLELGMYVAAAQGTPIKAIIETSQLSDDEIKRYCHIINAHDIAFAKTSTGFVGGGATVHHVKLLREHLDPKIKIKASGGIQTKDEMLDLIEAGADVLGMSRVRQALEE